MKVPTKVFNAIHMIQKSGIFKSEEMREVEAVIFYCITVHEPLTAEWIRANKHNYLVGLLEGFEIDNSQNAQLKEIHANE